jgi:hypothetical protein
LIGWLIYWCLTPSLAIFQLYHGLIYWHVDRCLYSNFVAITMRYISCDRKYRRSQHVPQKSKSLQPNNECFNNVINYYILLCEVLLLNIICHKCTNIFEINCQSSYISYINMHPEKYCWFENWIFKNLFLKIYRSQTDYTVYWLGSHGQKSTF